MMGGVKRTADFLERATWALAIALFALVLLVNMLNPGAATTSAPESAMEEVMDDAPQTPVQTPTQPAPTDLPESAE